jgi:outer membrane protein TolC
MSKKEFSEHKNIMAVSASRRYMKPLFAFIVMLVINIPAFSQTNDSVYVFSIQQAVQYALNNQKDVLNAQIESDISRYKVKETVGIGLPQVSGSIDVKDFEHLPVSLIPAQFFGGPEGEFAPVQFGTRWNATAGINASQLIFDPSYIVGVKAAKTYRDLSTKNLERTKIETAVVVTKAYYSVLVTREAQKVLVANEVRLKKLLNDTKALYENGFVEKIDYDRVQVAYNNIVTENENYVRTVDLTERSLVYQAGLPANAKIQITDSLDANAVKNMVIPAENPDPMKRIEYSIISTQQLLQEFNVKRFKGQYLPSLVLYGTLNTQAQRTAFNFTESGYRWYPTGIIGATLSLNLFDGMQRENKIRQERLAMRKIENEKTNFENAINLESSSNRANLVNALASLNVQDKNLALAESVNQTAKIKYDQGVGSNIEVLDAETSLKEAQVNYMRALYNALVAKIDLDKALGNFKY